ncbi:MAG: hypothetical protein R3B82_27015 [Sandaracinaceae bacterium]
MTAPARIWPGPARSSARSRSSLGAMQGAADASAEQLAPLEQELRAGRRLAGFRAAA